MALLAVLTELVSAAFGHEAKPAPLADATVNEIGANAAAIVAEAPAPAQKLAVIKAARPRISACPHWRCASLRMRPISG